MTTTIAATPHIRPAATTDLAAVEELLRSNGLPTDGVEESLDGFLVADHDGTIVGVIGVEQCCPEYGLLRSTAVAADWRSRGVGRRLVERAIAAAESRGTRALYLLTMTAERYFPSFGFVPTSRDQVPPEVQATTEFCSVCPSSATVMALELAGQRPAR
jgi:amino-acid N-acetyltransferase